MEHLYADRPDAASEIAYHFDAAGHVGKALYYHGLAAQRAEAVCAWQEAERHQGRMLELLDHLDPQHKEPQYLAQRGQVLASRAHLRFLQGRLAERDMDLGALEELAEASHDPALRLQALLQRVRYLNMDGQYTEAITRSQKGLALARQVGDVEAQCGFLAQIGFAHYFRGDYQRAIEPLRDALALEPADPTVRGEVLSVLSYTCYLVADYERSLQYREQALAVRSSSGQMARVAEDLVDMGVLHTRLHNLPEAEHYLTEALSLAREIGSQPAESYALNNLGNLRYLQGDYPAALQCYTDALALQRATGSKRGEASALANSGMTLLALGDYAAAESLLRQSLAIQEEIKYQSGRAEGLAHLALTLAGLGRLEEALTTAQQALALAKRIGDRYSQVTALVALARLHLRAAQPAAALPLAAEAVSLAKETGLVHGHILGLTLQGLAYLASGEPTRGLPCTTEAVSLLHERGCIEGPEEAVYLAHYRVLSALGRREEAARALSQAREEAMAKADRISDPQHRQRYLTSWKDL
jgi:tetratricopeptide (TPR) repeat protein